MSRSPENLQKIMHVLQVKRETARTPVVEGDQLKYIKVLFGFYQIIELSCIPTINGAEFSVDKNTRNALKCPPETRFVFTFRTHRIEMGKRTNGRKSDRSTRNGRNGLIDISSDVLPKPLIPNRFTRSTNNANALLFRPRKCKTVTFQRCFVSRFTRIWNTLPEDFNTT